MEIKQAEFITSVANVSQIKDYGMPEFAIAGKSNVGKSSFINYIVNNKSLAKTSATPGRTRLLNYFEINNGQFMFVDLPGYGYAKIGGEDKDNWDKLIGLYLTSSLNLKSVLVLVDVRHEPSPLDTQMVAYLQHYQIPFFVIATKADKLSKMQVAKQKTLIAKCLNLNHEEIFISSALTKIGKNEILAKIETLL